MIPRKNIFSFLFILILVSLQGIVKAQEIKFTFMTSDNGLSHMNVTDILQDKYGFIWIATEDGLSLFDGYSYTNFLNDPNDPNSISNNYIYSLAEDNQGDIWIGTQKGINLYNRKLNIFERFVPDPNNIESLSNDEINNIFIDSKNQVWAATANGLNLFVSENSTFKRFLSDEIDPNSLTNGFVNKIYEDSKGQIWVGTRNGLSLKNADDTFTNFFASNEINSLSSNKITSIFEDSDKNLWIGTLDGGLNKMNPDKNEFTRYFSQNKNSKGLSASYIYDIQENHDGRLWIATTNGIYLMNKHSGLFSHYFHSSENESSLSSNIVSKIYFDKDDRMWLGTRFGGVNIYDKNKFGFRHFKNNRLDKNSLSGNNVTSFAEDEFGNFYIGIDGGGLNYFNRETEEFIHVKIDPKHKTGFSSNKVLSLKIDQKGGMWIGYWGGGLDYFNRKTGEVKHYKNDPKNPKSLSDNNIFYIFEDKKGNIWIGTWGKGMNKYNSDTDDFTQYVHDTQDPNSLGSVNGITNILEDYLGNLWISMETGGGLDMLDPVSGNFTHYKTINGEGSLSNNSVMVTFEDSRNRLWVGTNGGGLNLFDRASKQFKAYRIKDGLPNETIVGILEDNDNNLWLSTYKGLSKFNLENGTFKNYSIGDGLQSQQFNRWAFLQLSSGEMLFGGINGFNIFKPENMVENSVKPPVYVTDFKLFNKPVKIGESEVLKENIFFTKELTLQYDQNFFSFEFTALNYVQPEKNQYKYIMEGLQKEWVEAGSERKVSYTNLSPGDYVFKVIGSNNDGVWNTEGAKIKIRIIPPFWQTWWFRSLILFSIIGSAIAWYKIRMNEIKRQKILLEKQVEERTAELVLANEEISAQGKKLTDLFSDMKDSIRAAQVIQQFILPSDALIKQYLPESFVYFRPKDVVSGDFYWFDVKDENIIIASVDCTGHGVSGAFMSINGHHLLNQAIYPYKDLKASEILNRLNEGIVAGMQQDDGENNVYDGMDIGLCILSKNKKSLQYAGANNPLYILRNKEIIQVKANGFAIGVSVTGEINTFTNHEIELHKNDIIYLFSDGYADQLGGETGYEKFMYKRFREMLLNLEEKNLEQQFIQIDKRFNDWKKDQEQIDDILVIGFKIS